MPGNRKALEAGTVVSRGGMFCVVNKINFFFPANVELWKCGCMTNIWNPLRNSGHCIIVSRYHALLQDKLILEGMYGGIYAFMCLLLWTSRQRYLHKRASFQSPWEEWNFKFFAIVKCGLTFPSILHLQISLEPGKETQNIFSNCEKNTS